MNSGCRAVCIKQSRIEGVVPSHGLKAFWELQVKAAKCVQLQVIDNHLTVVLWHS